jgi:Uma2 family endonuclease
LGDRVCFTRAPEICVEVLSPGNTQTEIEEKMALDFEAGAKEVWVCNASGAMKFFGKRDSRQMKKSEMCPQFPKEIKLRR